MGGPGDPIHLAREGTAMPQTRTRVPIGQPSASQQRVPRFVTHVGCPVAWGQYLRTHTDTNSMGTPTRARFTSYRQCAPRVVVFMYPT